MVLGWGGLVFWFAAGGSVPVWAIAPLVVVGGVGCYTMMAPLARWWPWRPVPRIGWYAERLQEDAPTVADLWPSAQQPYVEGAHAKGPIERNRLDRRREARAAPTMPPRRERRRARAATTTATPETTASPAVASTVTAPGTQTAAKSVGLVDVAPARKAVITSDTAAPTPPPEAEAPAPAPPVPPPTKAIRWTPIVVEAGPPTFSVSWWRPEPVGDGVVRNGDVSFLSRTVVRVVVRNRHTEADFSARARLLPWQARRDYPREELPPSEYHVVPWEETASERIAIEREITKKLDVAWLFADPQRFWFREPGGVNGLILEPLSRSVRFEIVVTNEHTRERVAKVCRIVFAPDGGVVEDFDVDDVTVDAVDGALDDRSG
jgi:hypothetical protein